MQKIGVTLILTPDQLNESETTQALMLVTHCQILKVLIQVVDRIELEQDTSGQYPLQGLNSLTRNHHVVLDGFAKRLVV